MTSTRQNSFDAVRLGAALLVIVGHAWPLTGLSDPPRLAGIPIFSLAVYVFFALSGYLISTSWRHDPRPIGFLLKRVGRIFPALIVTVLISVLIVGPLVTSLNTDDYFARPETWRYLQNLSLVAVYELPGVFSAHPRPVVNGVLWTLGPEFLCYLGVMAIGMIARRTGTRRTERGQTLVFLAIGLCVGVLSCFDGPLQPTLRAVVFFAVGALYARADPKRLPLWPVVPGLLLWLLVALAGRQPSTAFAWVLIPYAVLALGGRSLPVLSSIGRFGDFSYGTYLYGFLVQQIVWQLWPNLPLWIDIVIVVLATSALAACSWYAVERPALAAARRLASARPAERESSIAPPRAEALKS